MTPSFRPVLASSCGQAATAAEARYRIDADIAPAGIVAVIGLDAATRGVLTRIAEGPWTEARCYIYEARTGIDGAGPDSEGAPSLRPMAGRPSTVADVARTATSAVLLATDRSAVVAAATVAAACDEAGLPTAGFVLDGGDGSASVAAALRPYTGVLLERAGEDDVIAVLSALRA